MTRIWLTIPRWCDVYSGRSGHDLRLRCVRSLYRFVCCRALPGESCFGSIPLDSAPSFSDGGQLPMACQELRANSRSLFISSQCFLGELSEFLHTRPQCGMRYASPPSHASSSRTSVRSHNFVHDLLEVSIARVSQQLAASHHSLFQPISGCPTCSCLHLSPWTACCIDLCISIRQVQNRRCWRFRCSKCRLRLLF